jgi:hypothetical protein
MAWLRNHDLDHTELDDGAIQRLSNLAVINLPIGCIEASKKKEIVNDSTRWLRENELSPSNLDDTRLLTLFNFAGLPLPELRIRRKQMHEKSQEILEWLRHNKARQDELVAPTLRCLRNLPSQEQSDTTKPKMTLEDVSDWPRTHSVDDNKLDGPSLISLCHLVKIPLAPAILTPTDKAQIVQDCVNWFRNKDKLKNEKIQ